ncbi:putative neuroblastoma breakpoint family member 8 [Cebus imitator]|uniref:putative neuroblastoma breakpoint family member 8 n=1 Tax=Cebus imitator TaxID=2715852 RepID=UPI00189A0BA1|nr:putative neuroblastoma breakpoint family member 8 [Cebus imitator]
MSQVAYYLGCRLKTEVPGYLCSAPNFSMVASGRPPSRTNTEVNVPEGIEKSCSQQEENKPNYRASKNRLLMSQVAYFLNYRLKTYRDRKDQNEEQKCRDSKNKLLMSQVAYYLGCWLKREIPGFLCSAPNVTMVASDRPPSRTNTEVNVPEGIEKSCCQQEENKPTFGASKNRLLMSQVAYFLNYRLKTYKDQKCHEEGQKQRDSKNKLLTSQVAHYLRFRLKTEKNNKDEDEDVHVVKAEKIQESRAPREVQKIEVKKVPEDSLEKCVITHSNSCGPTDSSQPHRDTNEITFEEENVDSALVVESESSHDVVEDALIILSGGVQEVSVRSPSFDSVSLMSNLQESVEEEAPQESWDEGYSTLSIPPGTSASNESYRSNLHSEEQQVNVAVDIGSEYSTVKLIKLQIVSQIDPIVFGPCSAGRAESCRHCGLNLSISVDFNHSGFQSEAWACETKKDQEKEEGWSPLCPRLSMELVEAEEPEVFWYSLDILCSTYTAYLEFYYTCQAYTYAIFLFVEEHVRLTLDMDSRFLTMTVIRLHLVSQIGVIFPH